MFCPKCGLQLPEKGDCPSCGQPRVSLDAAPRPVQYVEVPVIRSRSGRGWSRVIIGLIIGLVVGILICLGMLSSTLSGLRGFVDKM
jgi:hypothetical protein